MRRRGDAQGEKKTAKAILLPMLGKDCENGVVKNAEGGI
jgi:hypothetical protein